MKKFYIILLLFFCIDTSNSYAIDVYVNNEMINFDVVPFIESGRTLVPIRGVFEKNEHNN